MMVICDPSGKKELFVDIHTFITMECFMRAYNIDCDFFHGSLKERASGSQF